MDSCSSNSVKSEVDSSQFDYVLKGIVTNGEGLNVELDFPQSIDKSQICRIEDGEFRFEGSSDRMKLAEIRMQGSRAYGRVLIEPGKSVINYDLEGDSINPYLSIVKIKKGRNGKLLYDFYKKVEEAVSGRSWTFGDPIMMDSMRRLVYPNIREQVFPIYDKYFDRLHSDVQLILMNSIADRLEGPGYFDKKDLDSSEIKKIRTYFSRIDTSLSDHWAYRNVKTSISLIEEFDIKIKFHEYELPELDETVESLHKLVSENRYTILDFWWNGCVPCRRFNVEMKTDYEKLQKNGVEIIGINIDKSRDRWEKASSIDRIEWPNYFGGHTDIGLRYQVNKFPTYIIFNQNHEILAVLNTKGEIMTWLESEN